MMMRTIPNDTMPALEAELVGGGTWRLAAEREAEVRLIDELEARLTAFTRRMDDIRQEMTVLQGEMERELRRIDADLTTAAANADRGFPSPEETAIAKAFCNQAGFEVANEALQVMGGLGYSQEELVEYCVRRCRGWMIAGGSVEILKNRIAESIFGRSFAQRREDDAIR